MLKDKVHLQGFDSSNGEVDKRREEEAEQEGGRGEHVTKRRGKEKADEEDNCRCREYGGD